MRSNPTALAGDHAELIEHLVFDRLVKAGIVAVALVVLALGMVVVWRLTGRRR